MQFTIFGRPTSTGRVAVGTIVLVVCEIIAVVSKVDGEYGWTSAIAMIVGFSMAALIWFYKSKPSKRKL